MLGYDPERIEVLLYQLVHLTSGGQQRKMSKRRGDVVFLDEFMDEVGVDAARWYLVNRGPDTAIEIDVDLAAEKSVKNPVYYVQYAHARIAGILRNSPVEVRGSEPHGALQAEERDLIKRLAELPVVVAEAASIPPPAREVELREDAEAFIALAERIFGRRRGGGGLPEHSRAVVAFVDGRRWNGDPRAIPLRRHAQIELELGPLVPPHAAYLFPGSL